MYWSFYQVDPAAMKMRLIFPIQNLTGSYFHHHDALKAPRMLCYPYISRLQVSFHTIHFHKVKSLFHMTRRFLKKTRARNSWEVLHWFQSVGIRTIKPVLIYEELGLFGALNSVLVTEEIEGKRLDHKIQDKEEPIKTASLLYNFFKRMQWIDFNHGDAKSSNFFISTDRLVVFDLDSSIRYFLKFLLGNRIDKDKKRILRSLEDFPRSTEALKLRFKRK